MLCYEYQSLFYAQSFSIYFNVYVYHKLFYPAQLSFTLFFIVRNISFSCCCLCRMKLVSVVSCIHKLNDIAQFHVLLIICNEMNNLLVELIFQNVI